jgi:hypothetical protein
VGSVSRRVRAEFGLTAVLAMMTVLTAAWPDWIEGLTGFDPDHGNGWAEWLLVLALAVLAIAAGLLARRDLLRVRAAGASLR